MPGGVRDQVREALERDDVAVVDELARPRRQVTISAMPAIPVRTGRGGVPLCTVIQRSSVNSSTTAWPPNRPEAAVLDAAERHLRLVADRLVVDVDDARLDALGEREAAVGVRRDDPGESP